MTNIQPLSGNVLIEPVDAETVSAGGIIIPDAAKEKPSHGIIVALAADATDEVRTGDRVIYKKFSGTTVSHDGTDYIIVPDNDLLAKFVESDAI